MQRKGAASVSQGLDAATLPTGDSSLSSVLLIFLASLLCIVLRLRSKDDRELANYLWMLVVDAADHRQVIPPHCRTQLEEADRFVGVLY
jgi:hypothetical protein